MERKLEIPINTHTFSTLVELKHVAGTIPVEPLFFLSTAESPIAQSLVFASTANDFLRCQEYNVSVIVAKKGLANLANGNICVFEADNIPLAMARILSLVDTKKLRWPVGVATTARIHPSAKIGKNVSIADFTFIGEGATVGDGTTLGAHVVVERHAQIGSNTFLHPHVVIGAECTIGSRVEIHSHSTIGSDGFGFVPQKDMTHLKLPQIGTVQIEDDVEIGANCAIDRATISSTRIKAGVKIDNLVHIAHNCEVGANSRLAAGFFLAGSSRLGANFLTGGSSVVSDHITVCDNVTIGGKSVVTKDIQVPGIYAGYPLEPLKQAMKSIANIAHLTALRKQVQLISKKIGLDTENNG